MPELLGTGYDGTHACATSLTMTTGVDWVEDHRDPDEPGLAARSAASPAAATPATCSTRCGPAPPRHPVRLLHRRLAGARLGAGAATGLSYAEDLARLWRDLGCTNDAAVAVDGPGSRWPAVGWPPPHATGRGWRCWRDGATDRGERLLDPAWVEAAARPAYPFLGVGRLPSSITTHAGFGWHWWPMDDAGRRVTADGSRGQFACVDRRTGAVVVKTSQWPYDDLLVDRQPRDLSYLGLHALLDAVDRTSTGRPSEKESA